MVRGPSREREVRCVVCETTFLTRHSQGKYCSPACARLGWRKSWRDYASRNRETRRDWHRGHYIINRDRVIERTKAYQRTPAGRRAQKISGTRQREKYPERYAARQAVLVAVRSGRLVRQACVRCGNVRAQAHHHDYSKPLNVTWLCKLHHDIEGRRAAKVPIQGSAA